MHTFQINIGKSIFAERLTHLNKSLGHLFLFFIINSRHESPGVIIRPLKGALIIQRSL